MPYTAKYNALFAKSLVEQLIAIIQRDQASAIAVVNSSLGAIQEVHKGATAPTGFPWLVVWPSAVSFDQDSLDSRHYHARLHLAVYWSDNDPDRGQDLIHDYARLLDVIVTSSGPPPSFADMTTALAITWPWGTASRSTTPPAPGTVKEVFVESHDYGVVAFANIDTPVYRAVLTVLVDVEET